MIFQIIIQLIALVFIVAIEVTDFVIERKNRSKPKDPRFR